MRIATAARRLTGLLSADLLLIQVLLMARIPWVERVWGQDQLTMRHRLVGFTSFWLIWVHILLITVGYAQAAHRNLIAEGWNLIRLVVSAVVPEADGMFSVVMTGHNLHLSGMQPGQFCQWRFLTRRGWSRPQPFSLSAPPTVSRLRITVQRIGEGTERLAGIRPGTRVHFEGPYGTMTADRRTRRDVLLIGAGVGITPMRGLAEAISRKARRNPGHRSW